MAAKRVMERVSGVNIVPHFCRIEDKEIDFYKDFSIIVLGLDSVEARSYINAVACGFLGAYFLTSLVYICFILRIADLESLFFSKVVIFLPFILCLNI